METPVAIHYALPREIIIENHQGPPHTIPDNQCNCGKVFKDHKKLTNHVYDLVVRRRQADLASSSATQGIQSVSSNPISATNGTSSTQSPSTGPSD